MLKAEKSADQAVSRNDPSRRRGSSAARHPSVDSATTCQLHRDASLEIRPDEMLSASMASRAHETEAGMLIRFSPGSPPLPGISSDCRRRSAVQAGLTLIEMMVVVSIIAIACGGVVFAMRDTSAAALERESSRLSALLESARFYSRLHGIAVQWRAVPGGFRFDGLRPGVLPTHWLDPADVTADDTVLVLGPEPLIGPQSVLLTSAVPPHLTLRVASDGLRPFEVRSGTQ